MVPPLRTAWIAVLHIGSMEETSAAAAWQQQCPPPVSWFLIMGCCLFVGASVVMFKKKKTKKAQGAQVPPPPQGAGGWWWCVLETMAFVADNSSGRGFYHFVESRHRRYGGPCFRTSLFGHTHVFISDPKSIRRLLLRDDSCFSKRYVRTVAELLGEHSLLCASHDGHRSLRRAITPLFFNSSCCLTDTFDALTRTLISDWCSSSNSSNSVHVVVLDAALGITFEAILGGMLVRTLKNNDKLRRRMQRDVLAVTQAMLSFPLRMPGTRFHAGLQARNRIMDVLRHEIASRRQPQTQTTSCNDFLHSLLHITPSLSDQQILDNVLTLIIAGQVTTATAITWMLKYLADDTDLQEKLRSVQLELAPKHQDLPLTPQQLNGMDFAYKVVKESLRMATIVSWFPRVALQDCQVAGFHINKGWIVNVDARSLHYDPTIYHNPTMFDPSRFDEEPKANSFLAFGAGGRTCLGMNLAKMMMLIFLHRLVTTFRWEMADDDPSLEKWAMFPRLKNGCPLHLTPI